MNKRQQLKIACASAGITIKDFAQQVGVTDAAVHRTLNGCKSERLNNAIEKFINRQFKTLKIKSIPQFSEGDSHAA